MSSGTVSAPPSKALFWAGWICSVLPALVFFMSGAMKFVQPKEMPEQFDHLGWPMHLAIVLGILEVGSTVLYLIPQTAVLGAVLLTGYLGGAIATHVSIGEPVYLHVVIGILIWLGIYLRDARLRALLPLRK